jgi:sulfate adenylyltransferase
LLVQLWSILPHGESLINLILEPEHKEKFLKKSNELKSILINLWTLSDLELIATWTFSPLKVIMGQKGLSECLKKYETFKWKYTDNSNNIACDSP